MAKLRVKKQVIRRAAKILKEPKRATRRGATPLPVFKVWYPLHGSGVPVERVVRVTEADDRYIKGFQIQHQFDTEPGRFRNFDRVKLVGLEFLHLST